MPTLDNRAMFGPPCPSCKSTDDWLPGKDGERCSCGWPMIMRRAVIEFPAGSAKALITKLLKSDNCQCIDCGGTEPAHSPDCEYMNELLEVGWVTWDGSPINPVPGKLVKCKANRVDLGVVGPSEHMGWEDVIAYRVIEVKEVVLDPPKNDILMIAWRILLAILFLPVVLILAVVAAVVGTLVVAYFIATGNEDHSDKHR